MKKALTKTKEPYHYKDGIRVEGKNNLMSGDCSNLSGDCSGLSGDCTGLRGNCTCLSGNLNDCEITDEEREKGINIEELIKE